MQQGYVVLQRAGSGALGAEERLIASYASTVGMSIRFLGRSELRKNVDLLHGAALCSGGVTWVKEAMLMTGRQLPFHDPYPMSARPFLYRRVWRMSRLYDALDLAGSCPQGLFIKPHDGWKRFTGFVVTDCHDRHDPRLNGYSRNAAVWCSEVIQIASEWRVYVLHDVTEAVCLAPGCESEEAPEMKVVEEIRAALAGQRSGYVFDVAVANDVATGLKRTMLLEVNDGFSFGAYSDVAPEVIFAVQRARWEELRPAMQELASAKLQPCPHRTY